MPSSGVQTCALDRKSTRLNSSHGSISYAVFCVKKRALRSEEHTSELQSRQKSGCPIPLHVTETISVLVTRGLAYTLSREAGVYAAEGRRDWRLHCSHGDEGKRGRKCAL